MRNRPVFYCISHSYYCCTNWAFICPPTLESCSFAYRNSGRLKFCSTLLKNWVQSINVNLACALQVVNSRVLWNSFLFAATLKFDWMELKSIAGSCDGPSNRHTLISSDFFQMTQHVNVMNVVGSQRYRKLTTGLSITRLMKSNMNANRCRTTFYSTPAQNWLELIMLSKPPSLNSSHRYTKRSHLISIILIHHPHSFLIRT